MGTLFRALTPLVVDVTRWPNGYIFALARLRIERSGFRPCCVLVKTLYSHCACLHPGISVCTTELSGKPMNNATGLIACDGLVSHSISIEDAPLIT